MLAKSLFKKNNILKTSAFLVSLFLISAMIALFVNAAQVLEFNAMSADQETLRMKNVTRGDSGWLDPIVANAGDELEFLVYYHCGWDDPAWPTEKAQDTSIRITFPTNLQSAIQLTARLWATNIAAVIDPGTINASSAQKLIFDNTATWFHNAIEENIAVTVGGGYVEKNIGDIACDCTECYNNAGFVVFKAQVSEIYTPTVDIKANNSDGPITINYNAAATLGWTSTNANSCTASGGWSGSKAISGSESTGNLTSSKTYTITCTGSGGSAQDSVTVNVASSSLSALNISKTSRNLTQGQTSFTNSISAYPSDRIEFQIQITSSGNTTASNVRVKDILPDKMTYWGNLKVDGSYWSGNILDSINLGSLAVGQTKTITFETQVFSEANFGYGTISLVNTANTWADNVSQITNTAVVNVTRTSPSPASPGLSIEKLARNLTEDTSFKESVSADPSDEIEFQIEITSIGDATAYNIIVKDVLPSNISYQGYLKINGVSSGGDILSDLNLGTLTSGLSKTIIFRAKVASEANFSYGTTSLVNTASVRADEVSKIYDSAVVNVIKEVPEEETELSIDKKVRNLTAGQKQWYETIYADPSDKIIFKIEVTNESDVKAKDITVKDGLPDKIAWYDNLEIDGDDSNADITKGVDIGDLEPDESITITFEALIASKDEFVYGTTELINSALAYNVDDSDSDTAKVKVTRTAVAGAVTEVPTGIVSSFLISFGVTLVLSYCFLLGFFLYQKTFVNSGITFNDTIAKAKSGVQDWYYGLTIFDSPEKSEKRLQKIISEIRAKES